MAIIVDTSKKLNSVGIKNIGKFLEELTIRFWNNVSEISDFTDLCDNKFEIKLSGFSSGGWVDLNSLRDCAILQDPAIGYDTWALVLRLRFIFTAKTQKTITNTDIFHWCQQLKQQLPDFCHVSQSGNAITNAISVGHSTPINIVDAPALGFVAVYLLTDNELEEV